METAQEALEENHLQVALSILAQAQVALALLILVLEMTFSHYHHKEKPFIDMEEDVDAT
jgi:hypothetical protein